MAPTYYPKTVMISSTLATYTSALILNEDSFQELNVSGIVNNVHFPMAVWTESNNVINRIASTPGQPKHMVLL